jgi:hypothetical protein
MTNIRARFLTLAAASFALAAATAPVQAAPAARASANIQGQNQSADAGRKICVRMEMPNSRLPRKICRTQAEWDRSGGVPTSD